MKKLVSLFREEDGAAEVLQVIILLGLAALVTLFMIAAKETIAEWGKDRVNEVLIEKTSPDENDDLERIVIDL